MKRILLLASLLAASCNAWQGPSGSRSSDWTWSCGGSDEDGDDTVAAPDGGCPMGDDSDGGT